MMNLHVPHAPGKIRLLDGLGFKEESGLFHSRACVWYVDPVSKPQKVQRYFCVLGQFQSCCQPREPFWGKCAPGSRNGLPTGKFVGINNAGWDGQLQPASHQGWELGVANSALWKEDKLPLRQRKESISRGPAVNPVHLPPLITCYPLSTAERSSLRCSSCLLGSLYQISPIILTVSQLGCKCHCQYSFHSTIKSYFKSSEIYCEVMYFLGLENIIYLNKHGLGFIISDTEGENKYFPKF